jgi:2-polyprenyl-3-methyl-5-hydroxy-6-metoxy-1,4-benzoquinol methylase
MKQVALLKEIISSYRKLRLDLDIVVVSEAPKDFGDDVEVIVGLPSKNPWTLPFAHKQVFADRVEEYDLFIYSEDDIGITRENIEAFVEITPKLNEDEIAGFLRYEYDAKGVVFLDEPWGHYHWKPDSVRSRGRYTVAEFTNEHAGFYILTRAQLKRALASGGFLRAPYRGRYNWPETAATDPYTVCGFRKVICISELERFLVHHASNKYVHQLDVTLNAFNAQLDALAQVNEGVHPAATLCKVESEKMPGYWQKSYYEKPRAELIGAIPGMSKTVLSIGCGWGETERLLQEQGRAVTAIPLDSIIGKVAEERGIEVVYGELDEALSLLGKRRFDCVLIPNLLHLQSDPSEFLTKCAEAVALNGSLVVAGPNFQRFTWRLKRLLRLGDYGKLRYQEECGLHRIEPRQLGNYLSSLGFDSGLALWVDHEIHERPLRNIRVSLGSHTARSWIYRSTRIVAEAPAKLGNMARQFH